MIRLAGEAVAAADVGADGLAPAVAGLALERSWGGAGEPDATTQPVASPAIASNAIKRARRDIDQGTFAASIGQSDAREHPDVAREPQHEAWRIVAPLIPRTAGRPDVDARYVDAEC
jgi:hypothetical protein